MLQKTLLFLFILLPAFAVSGQSLVVEGNIWHIDEVYAHPDNHTYYAFRISGDTVLNSIAYKKLYKGGPLVAALREEPAGTVRMVDFTGEHYGDGPNEEFVLYDFNAAVGDSTLFWRTADSTAVSWKVIQIDTMYVFGAWRERRWVSSSAAVPQWTGGTANPYFPGDYWIDGVGSQSMTLLPLHELSEYGFWIECFNGVDHEGQACLMSTGEAEKTISVKIAPNPASDRLTCTFQPGAGAMRIRLCNALGQVCRAARYTGQAETLVIDTVGLPDGFYTVVAENGSGARSVRPVVIRQE